MSFSSDNPLMSNQLPISIDLPADETEFNTYLTELLRRITNVANTKEGALYLPQELATFQQYFTSDPLKTRNVYRKVVDFGPLPNTGVKPVAHGINFGTSPTQCSTTRIYGSATDPVNIKFIPIPYASPTDSLEIELEVDDTFVNITTGSNRETFTRCTVVIEYTKNQ